MYQILLLLVINKNNCVETKLTKNIFEKKIKMDGCAVCKQRIQFEQNNPYLFHDTVFIKRSSKLQSKPWKNVLISISKQSKQLQIYKQIYHSSTIKHQYSITAFQVMSNSPEAKIFEIVTPQEVILIQPSNEQFELLLHSLQHTSH